MKIHRPEAFQRLPDAILFDLDNTLYPYDPSHKAGMNAIRHKVMSSLQITAEQFDKAFASARDEVKARLGPTASSHSRLLYTQRMLENIGLGSQVLLALDLEHTYWRTFLNTAELFPDVKGLLDDIRLLGIPIALVTDLTAQIQFRKIIYFGLDRFFECVVTSEESGIDKPSKIPFEMAIQKLRPSGERYWMIGDGPITDIKGGRDAIGAATLQKIHSGVKPAEGDCLADATFKDFSQIRSLLSRLVNNQQD